MSAVERCVENGLEVVLGRAGHHYEIIGNGLFLMATYGGASERVLVRAVLSLLETPRSVLIGGLGVGYSTQEALRWPTVEKVIVVEISASVARWNRTYFSRKNGNCLISRRVELVIGDFGYYIRECPYLYDAIVCDTDNGSDWLCTKGNAWLYGREGFYAMKSALAPGGAVSIWSICHSPGFLQRLQDVFPDVRALEVDDNWLYLARSPAKGARLEVDS
ncbi:MAG: spermine/spermidine synthase [Bacillota bacterium]